MFDVLQHIYLKYDQDVQGDVESQDALCVCVIFRKKRPIISGSFVENDLQLQASYDSPPCMYIEHSQ